MYQNNYLIIGFGSIAKKHIINTKKIDKKYSESFAKKCL
jgi:hypothetical protein